MDYVVINCMAVTSDIDIGLYYDEKRIDFSLLEKKARELDQEHRENLLARPVE